MDSSEKSPVLLSTDEGLLKIVSGESKCEIRCLILTGPSPFTAFKAIQCNGIVSSLPVGNGLYVCKNNDIKYVLPDIDHDCRFVKMDLLYR